MARSRRPELDKDNPVAPQPRMGRGGRRARPRQTSPTRAPQNEIGHLLQTLMEAAERFVNVAPKSKKLEAERNSLLDAITQTQWLLSVEYPAAKRVGTDRKRST